MRALALFLPTCFALLTADAAFAQAHGQGHGHAGSYADLLNRDIKALSPREQSGLEQGHGLGMALAAELNGYPGPRHVLDLGEALALSAAQREAVQAVFDAMHATASALGKEIVALERDLDRAFAERTITPERLDRLTAAIGQRRARLRAVHLGAHLQMMDVLDAPQRARYARERGYGG